MSNGFSTEIFLQDDDATNRFGSWLAPLLNTGDTILLEGPIGAGKTHLARAIIQALQQKHGQVEDVPSPTYTLVQTYNAGSLEIWHADLYRISDSNEVMELGLDDAFAEAVVLIEWPDRLPDLPISALTIKFSHKDSGRLLSLNSEMPSWSKLEGFDG